MNRETGGAISLPEHIVQSVADVLTTRLGTRVMRREYGCLLPELVDQPYNEATRLRCYAAIAMGLMLYEPRVSISRMQFLGGNLQGKAVLDLEGTLVDSNQPFSQSIPLQLGGSV